MIRARGNLWASWALAVAGVGLAVAVVVPWDRAGDLARGSSGPDAVLGALAIGCLVAAFLLRPLYHHTESSPPGASNVPTLTAWWLVAVAFAVLATMWATTGWLLHETDAVQPASARAQARIEAIRTGLTAAGALGAAAALLLTFRRQLHQEHAAKGVEYDAAEKRITDLYVKAAEQLGSAMAPVRMAGLYALERLAQGNPDHRQTIVNVICAYLRMPFTPPPGEPSGAPSAEREELQVRLTAQNILTDHLRQSTGYWGRVRLSLAGADLVELDLRGCHPGEVDFDGVTFHGRVSFEATEFHGPASFLEVYFPSFANFAEARFHATAWFSEATFHGEPGNGRFAVHDFRFSAGMAFAGASFRYATFDDFAAFRGAAFHGDARFDDAVFRGGCTFSAASFHGDARFNQTAFGLGAGFGTEDFQVRLYRGATFHRLVEFDGATFDRPPEFDGVRLTAPDHPGHVPPPGWRIERAGTDPVTGRFAPADPAA